MRVAVHLRCHVQDPELVGNHACSHPIVTCDHVAHRPARLCAPCCNHVGRPAHMKADGSVALWNDTH